MTMQVRVASEFDCSIEEFWRQVIQLESLKYVSLPLLSFRSQKEESLEASWKPGKLYRMDLYLFNLIPLGEHNIIIREINQAANTIISEESGRLIDIWKHTIQFNSIDNHRMEYIDTIDIEAGWKTLFIWFMAHIFYRHRQNRWKKLLSTKGMKNGEEV